MASIAFEEYKNKLNNLRPALDDLGGALHLDEARNEERRRGIRVISTDDSAVTVLVVPTNEELEIARQTLTVTSAR